MHKAEPRFRVTTELPNKKDFESAIVIPSYDEGYGILDGILSAINQKPLKNKQPNHCVVVVINNAKNAPPEKKKNNILTYFVLQALVHKIPISKRGDPEIEKKVKMVYESKVPIVVVDAFSEDFANEGSNVGMARRIGHKVAGQIVNDKGFYISTDADARLSQYAVSATKLFFDYVQEKDPKYAGATFGMWTHMEGTTDEEKKISRVNDIYWNLRELVGTSSHIEDTMVWFSGGGSTYTKESYEKVGGHPELPGEEDTKLGIAIAEAGYKVVNAYRNSFIPYSIARHMIAHARGRVSDRASTGMGRGIAMRDESKTPFKDQLEKSFSYFKHSDAFKRKLEDLYFDTFVEWLNEHPEVDGDYEDTFLYTTEAQKDEAVEQFHKDSWQKICDKVPELLESEGVDLNTSDAQKAYEEMNTAIESYRPNRPNTESHHKLYSAIEKVFKTKYKDEPMKECVSEYKKEVEEKIKEELIKYPSAQKLLLENQHKTAFTYESFYTSVVSRLPQEVKDLMEDENNKCKVEIMLLNIFTKYLQSLQKVFDVFQVRVEISEIREKHPEKSGAIWIRTARDIHDDLVLATLHTDFLQSLTNSLYNLAFAMEYEWDTKINRNIKNLAIKIQDEASLFAKTTLHPLQQKARDSGRIMLEDLLL